MGVGKKRVEQQLEQLLGGKILSDLWLETEWMLLEKICYQSARTLDSLKEEDLERPIPAWGGKSYRDLENNPLAKESKTKIVKLLQKRDFNIPSLDRYKIFQAQFKELQQKRVVDWDAMLRQ
jgi:hypothetical protein